MARRASGAAGGDRRPHERSELALTLTDDKRCRAKAKGSGERCKLPAIPGLPTCRRHGSATKKGLAKSARHLAVDRVRRSLDEVGVREVENPLDELRRLTSEVVAFKDWAASHVAALEERIRYEGLQGSEQLRAEVQVYERALDRAGKLLEMWARLGIDALLAEMQVKVTEAQVTAMTRGLDAYRLAAGVGETEHQAGLAAMAKEMGG